MEKLTFELEKKRQVSLNELNRMHLSDILSDDRSFEIRIYNILFFRDQYFPILEFVKYVNRWLNERNEDFIFITEDDYQNPILAFHNYGNRWKIYSVWQEFECETEFSFNEVRSFLENIVNCVICR